MLGASSEQSPEQKPTTLEERLAEAMETNYLAEELVDAITRSTVDLTSPTPEAPFELVGILCAGFDLPDLQQRLQPDVVGVSRLGYTLRILHVSPPRTDVWPSLAHRLGSARSLADARMILDAHPDLWAVDFEVWSTLRVLADAPPADTSGEKHPCAELAWSWLTSPGRRLAQDLPILRHIPGEEKPAGAVEWTRDRIYRAAGITPGEPPRDDGPPAWLELHQAVPGYHHLWRPTGGVTGALRLMERGSPAFLRGVAFGWLLNRAATSPVFAIGDWRDSLTSVLPSRVATAFEALASAAPPQDPDAELELLLLRHAARLTQGDPRLTDADRWRVARWLHGCIVGSPFYGKEEQLLVAELEALLLDPPTSTPPTAREPANRAVVDVLAALAPHLPDEVHAAAASLPDDPTPRTTEPVEAPPGEPAPPHAPLQEALLLVSNALEDPNLLADVLCAWAPHLPWDVLDQARTHDRALGPGLLVDVWGELVPFLPQEIVQAASTLEDPALQASVWRMVAPWIPHEVADLAQTLDDPWLRSWVQGAIPAEAAPIEPTSSAPDEHALRLLLEAAQALDEPLQQIAVQVAAANHLVSSARDEALDRALRATQGLGTPQDWATGWSALASHRPERALLAVQTCLGIPALAPDDVKSGADLLALSIAVAAAEHFRAENPTPFVPTPAPVSAVLRTLATRPLTDAQKCAEGADQAWRRQRWRLPYVAPPLLARHAMTRHNLAWLTASGPEGDPKAVLTECLDLFKREPERFDWIAHAIFKEGEAFDEALGLHCRSWWRAAGASLPAHPLALVGLSVLRWFEDAEGSDQARLLRLIERTEPTQQVSLLSAWVERARHHPEQARPILSLLTDLATRDDLPTATRLQAAIHVTRGLQRGQRRLQPELEHRLRDLAQHPPFQNQLTLLRELKRLELQGAHRHKVLVSGEASFGLARSETEQRRRGQVHAGDPDRAGPGGDS